MSRKTKTFKKQTNDYSCELKKGYLFHNKLEPLKSLHLFLGLRGYRKVKSQYSNVHWRMKIYVHSLLFFQLYTLFWYISTMVGVEGEGVIRKIARILIHITGAIIITMTWLSNTKTKHLYKIFKNFDVIERVIPKLNNFPRNNNILNLSVHAFFLFIILGQTIYYAVTLNIDDYNPVLELWAVTSGLATEYALYQLCIVLNMTSSYTNVLNTLICQICKCKEHNYNYREPFMVFVKHHVLQYVTPYYRIREEFQIITLKVTSVVKIYDKLMSNLELTNQKYNIVVSAHHLNRYKNVLHQKFIYL